MRRPVVAERVALMAAMILATTARAGDLTVDLGDSEGVTMVGAFQRFTSDGRPGRPVDPKAKIDAPAVDVRAENDAKTNHWVFRDLAPGRYDLVVLARGNVRVEGFQYAPVDEFEPVLPPDTPAPDDEVRDEVLAQIKASRHYENRVEPLYLAREGKQVRVLMQLVRDKPTSYDADYGQPAATVRHEVWQFSLHTGAWVKDRKTFVLDRVLLPRADLGRWTWAWEPSLGGIAVDGKARTLEYKLPAAFDRASARGWFPTR